MLGNQDDAEDALQSAFIRAFRNLAACREPQKFGSWLQRIVVNECRTLGTRRGMREARFDRSDATIESLSASSPIERKELAEEIEAALQRLSAEHREAFLLRYVEDLGYEEMSELTGAGISALKMRVKRACESLRALLEGAV
jgi:RNA polymerase sigma-70 factor (ECF subfamily)